MSATPSVTSGVPNGSEPISNIQTLEREAFAAVFDSETAKAAVFCE